MRECPACAAPLANAAVCCNSCGWQNPDAGRGSSHLCQNVERGQQCARPGTISPGTLGGGPWYCADHFRPRDQAARGAIPANAMRSIQAAIGRFADPVEAEERAALREGL